ncbi:MAG TPA: hypothetical protein VFD06_15285 [Candidatus Polarisedimenticolia bacterium]|nr:hypothetical protein [Candidatus Polarisedimenticolia bacterium]
MRRPGLAASVLLAAFALGGTALTVLLQPWESLSWSTWPSGYEAARIARNLSTGAGYASPFLALPGDNFLSDPPDSEDAGLAAPALQEPKPGSAPSAWVTPPYVLLWWLTFSLFGVYTPVAVTAFQILQVALMTCALAIAWRLVARLRGEKAGLLALALLVFYPSSWYFAVGDTHGTALFLVWLMSSLFTLERVVATAPGPWPILHGLSVALAILTEPVSLFFYLWLEVWAGFRLLRREAGGRGWRGGRLLATTGAALLFVVGPWSIRNLIVLGAPVPFKSNLPMEIYYGNNEESAWNLHVGHIRRFPAWNEEERLRLLAVGEPEYGRQCLLRAAMFLHEHPLTVLRLTLQRITYFWSYNPFRTTTWRPLLTLLFHLPLGVWLAAVLLRPRETDWFDRVCLGFFLLFPLLYYATHLMIYRYRFPLEAILLLAAASAWGRLKGWSREPLATPDAAR